jgi:PAS domain S-box-containing protein
MEGSARSGAIHQIWWTATILALAGCLLSGWMLAQARQQKLEDARTLTAALANTAAQHIAGSLRSIDQLLQDVALSNETPPAFPASETMAELRTRVAAVPELLGLALADSAGTLRLCTDPAMPTGYSIADRPHFAFQRAHSAENLFYIAPPSQDPVRKRTVILVSRPILGPKGAFLGAVTAAATPTYIEDALNAARPATDGAVALFTPKGVLMERLPAGPTALGASIADTDTFHAYREGYRRNGVAIDGQDVILGFAPVPNFSLVVMVSVNEHTILAPWRNMLHIQAAVQVGYVGLILLLALILTRSERRRDSVVARMLAMEHHHVADLSKAVEDRTRDLDRALRALRDSEHRFRRIAETAPMPLILTRFQDDHFVYINDAAADMFGIPGGTPEGMTPLDLYANPGDRTVFKSIVAQGGHVRDFEVLAKRRSGELFTVLLSASTFDFDGEPMLLVSVYDVTETKRLHQELARSNADLEQFSYAVSHDLQEPLRMISSYIALLKRRYGAQLDADAQEFIAFAVDGAQRMSRMITDLLDYSRVHRQGQDFSPVDLDQTLRDSLANLAATIETTAAQISVAPLPTVSGDSSQLMRVFQNLIGNALKYRQEGIAPDIAISAQARDGAWIISVADNGIGIDPADTGRLFQVFQRLHPRGAYEGSGIGLALCRRIVERHGGRIWVDSAGTGQGSVFHISLPSALHPSPSGAIAASPASPPQASPMAAR